jgi:hypothetical protein
MAFQPVPNTIIVELRGTTFSEACENTFYYSYVDTPDESDLETLLDALEAVAISHFKPYLPDSVIMTELYARDLHSEVAAQALIGITGGQGSATGEGMPSFNSLAISRRSGQTGRSARGRIYWLGLSESQVQGQTVLSTPRAGMLAAPIAFDAAAQGLGYTPVIVSRYHNNVKRAEGVTYEIQGWSLTDFGVDTRRSRKE